MRLSVACFSLLCCSAGALRLSPLLSRSAKCNASRAGGYRRWVRQNRLSPDQPFAALSRSHTELSQRAMCINGGGSLAAAPAAKTPGAAPSPHKRLSVSTTIREFLKNNVRVIAAVVLTIVGLAMVTFMETPVLKLWGFVIASAGQFLPLYSPAKEVIKDIMDKLPHSIDASKVVMSPDEEKMYVHRPALEQTLTKAFDAVPVGYTVIYGAKGVGKTAVMKRVAVERADRGGVVMLTVMTAHSPEDVLMKLTKTLTGKADEGFNVDKLKEAIKRCTKVPTIIFDVERGLTPQQVAGLDNVRSVCKHLAKSCRCFIVLSEANAVAEFGKDRTRENFVFVDEMTVDEAKKLLELAIKSSCEKKDIDPISLSEETMERVFKDIGTNAASLEQFASKVVEGHDPNKFMDSLLKEIKLDFRDFPFKRILKALKDNPDGVSPDYFQGVIEKGTELHVRKDVMKASKPYDIILYNKELDRYQLVSTAHKTALKTYKIPDQSQSQGP